MTTAPLPAASANKPPSADREKVAVLPLDDEELFRDERVSLRQLLASELAKRAPDFDVLPLAQVDAALRPATKSGALCAFVGSPLHRRARDQGWAPTDLIHVMGSQTTPEMLQVDIDGWTSKVSYAAVWQWKLPPMDRYRAAFASLAKDATESLLLGGLSTRGSRENALVSGGLEVCETRDFGKCAPASQSFSDAAPALTKCFGAADADEVHVLFDGARCEIANMTSATGTDGQLETCLCAAIGKSAGAKVGTGRRVLSLEFQAPDLVGKPRPALSVLEAPGNLFADNDQRPVAHADGGKTTYTSLQRLAVDNLDGLAAPLARCKMAAGAVVIAELTLAPTGAVSKVRLVAGAPAKKTDARCLEAALAHGAFACTDDGKPATLRVAASWPYDRR